MSLKSLIRNQKPKRVFCLVIDFGTSQSPKSTRPLTTYWCLSRPGHQALRNNFASSLLLRTWLPMTGRRVRRPTLFSLWRKARRENSAASRLLGSTSLRFALHGWQRMKKGHPHNGCTGNIHTPACPRIPATAQTNTGGIEKTTQAQYQAAASHKPFTPSTRNCAAMAPTTSPMRRVRIRVPVSPRKRLMVTA